MVYGIGVTYHKAVKKVCGLVVYDSNHLACAMAAVTIFKRLHAQRLIFYVYHCIASILVAVHEFQHN